MINKRKLFWASCFALITTAFSFSIRAGIMPILEVDLGLSPIQLGTINRMWFWGFPISMIIGGLVYRSVGGGKIMAFAFVAHTAGILLTIFAGSYEVLLFSSLLIGLGNGCTEAACNPMIADAYEGTEMSKYMNRFHMWFPGGILVGSLLSILMTDTLGLSWQTQVGVLLVPTVIYAFLFFNEEWPGANSPEEASLSSNFSAMLSPLFLFMLFCMAFTATTEFGTSNWVPITLEGVTDQPMLVLACTFGVMTIARYFGGSAVAQFNTVGVLLGSAVLSVVGVYLLSIATGGLVYVAAIIFGLGIAYFWPNMIGFVADYIPKSGAIGLSLVGAVGLFMAGAIQPLFGGLIEKNRSIVEAQGLSGTELNIATGQMTLSSMMYLPIALIILFAILHFWMKGKKPVSSMAH